jgi:two-component system sensor histidine kinase PilS (NtrC family)
MLNALKTRIKSQQDKTILVVYNNYRIILALLMIVLYILQPKNPYLGSYNPKLLLTSALVFLVIAVFSALYLRKKSLPRQVFALNIIFIDIVFLTFIAHANGGLSLQLNFLFIVIIFAANIIFGKRIGYFAAAIAAIGVLYQELYNSLVSEWNLSHFSNVPLLALSFFFVSLLSYLIVKRMRESEDLTIKQQIDIDNLQRLNSQIIGRMRTGIIAVNLQNKVLLHNRAAEELLDVEPELSDSLFLYQLSESLQDIFLQWQRNPSYKKTVFKNAVNAPDLNVSFAYLNQESFASEILVFLEDASHLAQQAQKIKLASLGHLSANISHEIRNPLSAINHAAQLLKESPDLQTTGDKRLIEIIETHCQRVNTIVENVLSISRRVPAFLQDAELNAWLVSFMDEFQQTVPDKIEYVIHSKSMHRIRFDLDQLHQVVTNLVSNGLRYSKVMTGVAKIELVIGIARLHELVYLDVIDFGPGIDNDRQAHLFEPFYTTEKQGTGLGLYLSREICEANFARLDFVPREKGACFRITFSHLDKINE